MRDEKIYYVSFWFVMKIRQNVNPKVGYFERERYVYISNLGCVDVVGSNK